MTVRVLPLRVVLWLLAVSSGAQELAGSVNNQDLFGQDAGVLSPFEGFEQAQRGDPTYSPWTSKPKCIKVSSPVNSKTKLCVYTYDRQNQDSVSIISTPQLAERIVGHLDEDPVSTFFRPDQFEDWNESPRPYEIVPIPGKGIGVRATRRIKQYETFMFDQASLLVDLDLEKSTSKETARTLLEGAIGALRNASIAMDLVGGGVGKSGKGKTSVEKIMELNAFGAIVGETEVNELFPHVARINHACNPNSFVMFSPSGLSVAIKAYRTIQPGEEVTMSYLQLGMSSRQRHATLARWGFNCTCALCSLPPDQLAISDARRERITIAEKALTGDWRNSKFSTAVKLAEEIVDLMKKEELTPMLTDEYVILAKLYTMLGDRDTAEDYAQEAVEILGNLGFLGIEADDEDWTMERLMALYGEETVLHHSATG